MKKLSVIFLISLSLLLTSCFNKEEKNPNSVVPKTEINNAVLPVENNSWITNIVETATWKEVSNTWIIEKPKIIIKEKVKKIEEKADNNEIKLIDAYVSDETEEVSEEEKEKLKKEISEIDTNTLVKLKNSRLYKDKNNVYNNCWYNIIKWQNPNNIKIIQPNWNYRTDWKDLYEEVNYCDTKNVNYIDIKTLKFALIKNSNVSFYAWWDKNNLYLWSSIFKWWDINSLQYIQWSDCLKDKSSIYCYLPFQWWSVRSWDIYFKIEWADISTFQELIPQTYYKDKNSIYYGDFDKILKMAWIQEISSFTVINDIPQDNKCTYEIEWTEATCSPKEIKSSTNLWEIKLIDAYLSDETEEISEEEKKVFISGNPTINLKTLVKFKNSSYYKDNNNVYDIDNFDDILNKIDWVNPKEFKTIQPIWYWYDWTFWYIKYIKTEKMKIDINSLIIKSFWDDLYAWDKDNLYIGPNIYKWDINTFEKIWGCYKDKYNVYCLPCECWFSSYELVKWVDVNSFSEIWDFKHIKDKNNLYLYDWTIIQWIQNIESFTFTGWTYQDNKCTYKIEWTEATCSPK